MPQWDFLNFLAENNRQWPGFHLHLEAEVTDFIQCGQQIRRVHARTRSLGWPLKLLNSWPVLRRIPARMMGMGFQPEHVRRAARCDRAPKAMARAQDL